MRDHDDDLETQDDGDDLEGAVALPVLHHLAFLPYREAHSVFMSHLHRCPRCTVAYRLKQPCKMLCNTGHVLCHEVDDAIDQQNIDALLN